MCELPKAQAAKPVEVVKHFQAGYKCLYYGDVQIPPGQVHIDRLVAVHDQKPFQKPQVVVGIA